MQLSYRNVKLIILIAVKRNIPLEYVEIKKIVESEFKEIKFSENIPSQEKQK